MGEERSAPVLPRTIWAINFARQFFERCSKTDDPFYAAIGGCRMLSEIQQAKLVNPYILDEVWKELMTLIEEMPLADKTKMPNVFLASELEGGA